MIPIIKTLMDLDKFFPTDKECKDYLVKIRWGKGLHCPHCNSSKKIWSYKIIHQYKCKACLKIFTPTVGTIFHRSHTPLKKWFFAIYMFCSHKKGVSSVQLAKDIGVQQRTAWYILHRIRLMMKTDDTQTPIGGNLGSVIEVDETLIGGKYRNKHVSKKIKGSMGRSFIDKAIAVGIKERGGKIKALQIANVSKYILRGTILKHIAWKVTKPRIITDEWPGYNDIHKFSNHDVVNHGSHEYVRGDIHTNSIEGFWAHLKRGIFGVYHHVSNTHLQHYLDEFAFRMNYKDMSEGTRFNFLMKFLNKRMSYKKLTMGVYSGPKARA